MRRVFLYLTIVVAVLLAAAVVGVQAVLWSDVPRRIVVGQLEKQLGLTARVGDLSTGWRGRTRLERVQLSLPLEDQPIIEVAAIQVDHAALLWLVLTGDLALDRLELDRPRLTARQAETGQWNVEQLIQVLQQRLAGGDGSGAGGPPTLPDVVVRDAAVEVLRYDQPAVTVRPVQIRGQAVSRLRYVVAMESPQVGRLEGHVAMGEPWAHEVTFQVQPESEMIASLLGSAGQADKTAVTGEPGEREEESKLVQRAGIGATGRYRGTIAGGEVSGTLALDRAYAGKRWVQGQVKVRLALEAGRLTAEPEGLAVHVAGETPLRVTGGQIVYTLGDLLRLDDVVVVGWGVDAVATGEGDPQRQTGTFTLTWRDSQRNDGVSHRGRAALTLRRGVTDRRGISLEVEVKGRSSLGEVDAAVTGQAIGADWGALWGRMTLDRLEVVRGEERYDLGGMVARLTLADGRLQLNRVNLPAASWPRRVAAEGFYDLGTGAWKLEGAAASIALPGMPLDHLSLEAGGDQDHAELGTMSVRSGGVELEAAGRYVYLDPQPLSLTVTIGQLPLRMGDDRGVDDGDDGAQDLDEAGPMVVADNLGGVLRIRGVVSPMDLHAQGDMTASALQVGGHRLGDLVMRVEGSANAQGARVVADAPQWLGGQWRAIGSWDPLQEHAQIQVVSEELDLGLAGQFTDAPVGVEGDAGLMVSVEVPWRSPAQFMAAGEFHADELAVASPAVRVDADRVEGRLHLDRRALRLTDIRMTRGGSSVDTKITVPLRPSPVIEVAATMDDWPVEIAPAQAMLFLTGEGKVKLHTGTGSLAGRGQIGGELAGHGLDLAHVLMDVELSDDRVMLRSLDGRMLGGTVSGQGIINLEELAASDLTIQWQDVVPQLLVPWLSPLDQWEGSVSGSLVAKRARDARALGPLRIDMDLDARQTTVRGLALGNGSATAYLDGRRFVLENFALQAMGGDLNLWGRVSPHGQEWFAFGSASARNVDLAAVTAALMPQRPVLGRLDADLTVSTPVHDWRVAFGRGRVEVRESDLANLPLFGALFDLVSLRIGATQPDGRGGGDLRIEDGFVILNGFRYQNRGTQINLVPLRIENIWAGEASPIIGSATLTQNLLPELEFFGSVNEALAVLQSDLVAARIEGTLGEPRVRVQALRGVTGELSDIITGGDHGSSDQRREQEDARDDRP